MRVLTALTLAATLLAPGLAFAMGCQHSPKQQAMSCAEGTAWDATSRSCKPLVSS